MSLRKSFIYSVAIFIFLSCAMPVLYGQSLDELLEMDVEKLLEVKVTSASKKEQHLKDAPSTMTVVTAKQIRERGYQSLSDLVKDLPGFQFRNIQGFNSYIFLRGTPNQNNYILLLVDGILINELNSGGFYGGLQYNLADIKQVEIVYGPSSVLYGTNAISGIINLITFSPEDNKSNELSAMVGSFNQYSSDFYLTHYNKNTERGFSISVMTNNTDKEYLGEEAGGFNWTEDFENFEKNMSLNTKIKLKNLKAGLFFQDKHSSRTTNYRSYNTPVVDYGTDWHIRFLNLYLKHDYNWSANVSQKTTVFFRDTTVEDDTVGNNTNTNGQVGYYRPNHSTGIESVVNIEKESGTSITLGVLYEKESLAEGFSTTYSGSVHETPPAPPSPSSLSNSLVSTFARLHINLTDSSSLNMGGRYDRSSYYNTVFTPEFSYVFKKNSLIFKYHFRKAFRAPKPWDYSFGTGNPELLPEKISSNEISIRKIFTECLSIQCTFYKNRLDNALERFTSDTENFWVNGNGLTVKGVELSAEYNKKSFSSYANITRLDSEDPMGLSVAEIAPYTFNTGLRVLMNDSFIMHIRLNYTGKRKNHKYIELTESMYIDPAWTGFCSFTYKVSQKLNAQLTVNNIFDKVYFHTSNRPPDRYKQPERNINLRVRYRF